MSDQSAEKQHQATARRIDDLRKKGQTLRSRDLSGGLVFIIAISVTIYLAPYITNQIKLNYEQAYTNFLEIAQDGIPFSLIRKIIISNFLLLLPIFFTLVIAALLSPYLFGGWNFTLESMQFNFEKLNPIANLGNIFSTKIFLNVAKSLLKVIVILSVLGIFTYKEIDTLIELSRLPFLTAITDGFFIIKDFIVVISTAIVFIVLYDVVTNFYEFQNRIKMTTQELKDEFKETEGNTDVKRKMKSVQFALLKQRLNVSVPKATVIITNPTHYAIAVRYNDKSDKAPKVIAKGKDQLALQIRKIAVSHSIPIYEAPPLARALYNTAKLNTEINPGLYTSVAIVLSYVHQLRYYQLGIAKQPQFITDLKIPDEFIFNE